MNCLNNPLPYEIPDFFFFLLFTCRMQAQFLIKGKVIDNETHQPLELATVTLTRDSSSTVYKYALTDPKGCFSFSVSENISWTVHVTYLGYQKESLPVQKGKEMIFQLKPEAISLKEVEIKGGRIYGRQDTVKYNLSRFTSGKEQSIKEALKKLPGIDINEQSGEIRYNGKAISQFTVEGMDVSGGRYNQITENLKADAVKDAEVIEHFQPIRSLRNKMPSDKVALNLTLKPEVRSRWLLTLQAAGGYGDPILYNGKLNALQLAHERQGIYLYKTDQTGKDLSTELQQLISDNQNFLTPADVPTFIDQPTFSFPLEKQRLMANTTHLASVNRLYRKTRNNSLVLPSTICTMNNTVTKALKRFTTILLIQSISHKHKITVCIRIRHKPPTTMSGTAHGLSSVIYWKPTEPGVTARKTCTVIGN